MLSPSIAALSSGEFRIQLRGAKRFRIHTTVFRECGRPEGQPEMENVEKGWDRRGGGEGMADS